MSAAETFVSRVDLETAQRLLGEAVAAHECEDWPETVAKLTAIRDRLAPIFTGLTRALEDDESTVRNNAMFACLDKVFGVAE